MSLGTALVGDEQTEQAVIVFIDTTELYRNPSMMGPEWELLGRYIKREGSAVFVSAVTVEEIVGHARRGLQDAKNEITSAKRKLSRFAPRSVDAIAHFPPPEPLVDEFKDRLQARLQELDILTFDADRISTSKLIARAVERRRPFDGEGKIGFRDAVIWESLLWMIVRSTLDSEAAVITSNTRDFCEPPEKGGDAGPKNLQLHRELLSDLEEVGRPVAVTVCPTLADFTARFIKPALERLNTIERSINEGRHVGFEAMIEFENIQGDVIASVSHEVESRWARLFDPVASTIFNDPHVTDISSPSSFDATVYRIDNNALAIDIDYELTAFVECLEEFVAPTGEPYYEVYEGRIKVVARVGYVYVEEDEEGEDRGVNEYAIESINLELEWSDWPTPEYD